MRVIPVFVVTGFLDSGKTTLVRETLMEQEWIEPGRTLLICCEEGEIPYTEEYLQEKDMVLEQVTEMETLTPAYFKELTKKYRPVQVVIEYNGMWKLSDLLSIQYPRSWELQGRLLDGQRPDSGHVSEKHAQHADGTADRIRADRDQPVCAGGRPLAGSAGL